MISCSKSAFSRFVIFDAIFDIFSRQSRAVSPHRLRQSTKRPMQQESSSKMVGGPYPRFLRIMLFLRQKSIGSHKNHRSAQIGRDRRFGARGECLGPPVQSKTRTASRALVGFSMLLVCIERLAQPRTFSAPPDQARQSLPGWPFRTDVDHILGKLTCLVQNPDIPARTISRCFSRAEEREDIPA